MHGVCMVYARCMHSNLLLKATNVNSRGDGTIPPDAVTLLEQLGGWLQLHGEAIYGTRP